MGLASTVGMVLMLYFVVLMRRLCGFEDCVKLVRL